MTLDELKAQLKDKTKTRTEKDIIRKEIAAEKARLHREKIEARQKRAREKEARKLVQKEQERIAALIRENPYFIFEGKDRWVDIRVEVGLKLIARFRGKAWIQVPAAMKAAKWVSRRDGRCAVIDQAEEGRLMVHFEQGEENTFE